MLLTHSSISKTPNINSIKLNIMLILLISNYLPIKYNLITTCDNTIYYTELYY